MSEPALYAVCLGGRAPGCNIELHDVVFAVGESLEAIYPLLLDRWFGTPGQMHVDAWARVESVPGFRVRLGRDPSTSRAKLWFVNIGGYAPGELLERHSYALYAGESVAEVKQRAKAELLTGQNSVHRDDLYAVDDLLAIERVDGWHLALEADDRAGAPEVVNGYYPIPRETVAAWQRTREQAGKHDA